MTDDYAWKRRGACRPPADATNEERRVMVDLMFPEPDLKEDAFEVQRAKQVCGPCRVRAECLAFALENQEPDGIWGGMTPRERRSLVREARRKRLTG